MKEKRLILRTLNIYPTGQNPKDSLEDSEIKLLDLIIRRFLSSFGEEVFILVKFLSR